MIAANTYRLSNLLRGLAGSEADMMELVSAGARVTVLGGGWQALPLSDTYIGEPISLSANAAGRTGDAVELHYLAKHLRPLRPVHVKVSASGENRLVTWIRQSRIGGENWPGMEVPLGEESELYRVQCLSNGDIISEYTVMQPDITLSQSDIDMSEQIAISQGSRAYGWGTPAIIDIPSLA